MPKPRIENFDERAQEAAYLSAEHQLSQQAISEIFDVGQASVSRMLERAKELGCLRGMMEFRRTRDIDDERMRQIESKLEHADLAARLTKITGSNGMHVRSVRVFDSGSTDTSPTGIDMRQRKFGHAAALRIAARLNSVSIVGVTWGSTVSRLLDGLARIGYPWRANKARRVVPVSAEPMRFVHNEYTSSTLARRLFEIMDSSNSDRLLALTGVPAFIPLEVSRLIPETGRFPKRIRKDLPMVFRRFFEENSTAFKEIFVGDNPLIDRIDTLITSAGAAEKPMGFCNEDLLKFGGLPLSEVRRLTVGDLGGVLLPAPRLSPRDMAKVDALNRMWTGIQRRHLETIARRAQEDDKPGIILITLGASRSRVVLEAIDQGLCTELIIDRELATALARDLDNPARSNKR